MQHAEAAPELNLERTFTSTKNRVRSNFTQDGGSVISVTLGDYRRISELWVPLTGGQALEFSCVRAAAAELALS